MYDCFIHLFSVLIKSISYRDLSRRGTPQTAFEFARLLFGLDPYTDPHGSSLYLDSFAIKAKQHDWLLKVWSVYEEMGMEENQINVTLMPGWNWSKALALFEQEGDRDSVHYFEFFSLQKKFAEFRFVVRLISGVLKLSKPLSLHSLLLLLF